MNVSSFRSVVSYRTQTKPLVSFDSLNAASGGKFSVPRCGDKKASIQYFLPVAIVKDLKGPVSGLASHFICNTSYIFLLALEFSLQATKVNYEKTVTVTSFQKPQCNPFQIFSIFFSFKFIHPGSLLCFLCCLYFLLMCRAVGGNSPVWN